MSGSVLIAIHMLNKYLTNQQCSRQLIELNDMMSHELTAATTAVQMVVMVMLPSENGDGEMVMTPNWLRT